MVEVLIRSGIKADVIVGGTVIVCKLGLLIAISEHPFRIKNSFEHSLVN